MVSAALSLGHRSQTPRLQGLTGVGFWKHLKNTANQAAFFHVESRIGARSILCFLERWNPRLPPSTSAPPPGRRLDNRYAPAQGSM